MITDTDSFRFSDDLPEATDVIVISAAIVGTATAYFLVKQGVRDVLYEKGRAAGEQSSRNWGWVHQLGRALAELSIMMEANRIWRKLAKQHQLDTRVLSKSDIAAPFPKSLTWNVNGLSRFGLSVSVFGQDN